MSQHAIGARLLAPTPGPSAVPRRFTEEQVARALRELLAGVSAGEVCRRYQVSERTLYRWRREQRTLELLPAAAPARPSIQLASARLQVDALRHALQTLASGPDLEQAARIIQSRFRMSTRRARNLVGLPPRGVAPVAAPG